MKKIMVCLVLIFSCSIAHAGIISFDSATTDNSITRTWLNQTFYKVYNTINGGINTDNLAAGAVASEDIATPANPLVRDNELIGEIIYSGLTIAVPSGPTSATSTITAGVAYVENDGDNTLHRVVTADTSKTFTVSKDTWVYLDYAGAFSYVEQAVGTAQPTTPTNSIVIAKVTTNGTVITAVVDYRQTSPTNLRIYSNYKNGLVISRDVSTATIVNIGRGEIELGSDSGGKRSNASSVNVDFTVTGRGGLDAGALASDTYYYIFAIADDATATAFDCIASLSSSDVTGFTGERLVGWCYADTASNVSPDSVGAFRGLGGDAPNIAKTYGSNAKTINTNSSVSKVKFYSSGRPVKITYSFSGTNSAGAQGAAASVSIDSASIPATEQQAVTVNTTLGGGLTGVYISNLAQGTHDIEFKASGSAGSPLTLNNNKLIVEEQ